MWLGNSAELDPARFGATMRQAKELEPEKFPCPNPKYLFDKSIQRVAQWCNFSVPDAEKMYENEPARFNRYLGWSEVESEAEPVAYAHAEVKAKRKNNKSDGPPPSLGSP